jgi:hypothetical protein
MEVPIPLKILGRCIIKLLPTWQCCGFGAESGSGRSAYFVPDLDPDRDGHSVPADPDLYQFQPNVKINNTYFFHKIFIFLMLTMILLQYRYMYIFVQVEPGV